MFASAAFAFTAKDRIYGAYALMLAGAVVYFRRNASISFLSLSGVFYDGVTGEVYGNELYGLRGLRCTVPV